MLSNSPQHSHLVPTAFRNLLRILNLLTPSFNPPSKQSLCVTSAAALYTKNMIDGGRTSNSTGWAPRAKVSTLLVILEMRKLRDFIARDRQLESTPSTGLTLEPFSNARSKLLYKYHYRHSLPLHRSRARNEWEIELTCRKLPNHRNTSLFPRESLQRGSSSENLTSSQLASPLPC